jgi:epoxyqueuosine reductase
MMHSDLQAAQRSALVKSMAQQAGFEYTGISKAVRLDDEARHLEQWLNKGMHGSMHWMENHFDKRIDPRVLVPGAKSVISLLLGYDTNQLQKHSDAPKISRYAYGNDYHAVIRKKLKLLVASIREQIGDIEGRVFVDSAPVMDKAWAVRSGLGWQGKHTNLIHPKRGSYFFIAEIISDLELEADGPVKDYCGTCTRCIDACPTDAILAPGKLDGSKCISYLTIELKEAIPDGFRRKMDDWMFGCDVCQEVCPWNRFSKPHQEPAFTPPEGLLEMSRKDWEALNEEVFGRVLGHSAAKRTGFMRLKRNIDFLNS